MTKKQKAFFDKIASITVPPKGCAFGKTWVGSDVYAKAKAEGYPLTVPAPDGSPAHLVCIREIKPNKPDAGQESFSA